MADPIIRGQADSKGSTEEDLNPLLKKVLDQLIAIRQDGKMSAADADYMEEGPYPFVCETCKSYNPTDQMCDKVTGPGEDGTVEPKDTCRLWTPSPRLAHPIKGASDGDS